jgi:hypothetical protein
MKNLCTVLPDLIAHVSRVACPLPIIILFLFTPPVWAEEDAAKYRV